MLHKSTTDFTTSEAQSYRQPMLIKKSFRTAKGNIYPICPRCNISMDNEYQNYCNRCGQALNWDKYDNLIF